MIEGKLHALRIAESIWATGSEPRRLEWQLAARDVVDAGRFALDQDFAVEPRGEIALTPKGPVLTIRSGEREATFLFAMTELKPLMQEYMQTCTEMAKLNAGAKSPRLEALDIAKRLTHDEAGERLRELMPTLQPNLETARRLFTLLVTLYHDTTTIAAPIHLRG